MAVCWKRIGGALRIAGPGHAVADPALVEDQGGVIYTTNAVESLNSTVRRAVRSKGHFPHDDAAKKLIYLALRGVAAKWKRPPQFWWQVKGEFAIRFEERFRMVQG